MEPTIEQQVQTRLAELPADVRDAIQSADLTHKMQSIGKEHQLHLDQLTALEQEIMMIMLGFSDPSEFVQNVVEEVHVTQEVADAITKEVSEQIFLPIRESMKHFIDSRSVAPETIPQSEMRVEVKPPEQVEPLLVVESPDAPPGTAPAAPAPPVLKPEFPAADVMLSQKTVTLPPHQPQPTQPRDYATDPYREPIEP